jgi:hypothetical protein
MMRKLIVFDFAQPARTRTAAVRRVTGGTDRPGRKARLATRVPTRPRRERRLAKRFLSVFIAAAVAAYTATPTPTPARWLDPATVGYCVSGTCSKFGGRRAANIKNCQPENCRDFVATKVKATAAMNQKSAATRKPLYSLTSWSWLWPHQDCVAANGINRALRQGEK